MKALLILCLVLASCGREYGERCSSSDECQDSLTCFGQAGAARCMFTCTNDNGFTCPDGYVCFGPRDLRPKGCYRQCEVDTDCPAEWACTPDNFGLKMCQLP